MRFFRRSKSGMVTVELAISLVLISVVLILVMGLFSNNLKTLFAASNFKNIFTGDRSIFSIFNRDYSNSQMDVQLLAEQGLGLIRTTANNEAFEILKNAQNNGNKITDRQEATTVYYLSQVAAKAMQASGYKSSSGAICPFKLEYETVEPCKTLKTQIDKEKESSKYDESVETLNNVAGDALTITKGNTDTSNTGSNSSSTSSNTSSKGSGASTGSTSTQNYTEFNKKTTTLRASGITGAMTAIPSLDDDTGNVNIGTTERQKDINKIISYTKTVNHGAVKVGIAQQISAIAIQTLEQTDSDNQNAVSDTDTTGVGDSDFDAEFYNLIGSPMSLNKFKPDDYKITIKNIINLLTNTYSGTDKYTWNSQDNALREVKDFNSSVPSEQKIGVIEMALHNDIMAGNENDRCSRKLTIEFFNAHGLGNPPTISGARQVFNTSKCFPSVNYLPKEQKKVLNNINNILSSLNIKTLPVPTDDWAMYERNKNNFYKYINNDNYPKYQADTTGEDKGIDASESNIIKVRVKLCNKGETTQCTGPTRNLIFGGNNMIDLKKDNKKAIAKELVRRYNALYLLWHWNELVENPTDNGEFLNVLKKDQKYDSCRTLRTGIINIASKYGIHDILKDLYFNNTCIPYAPGPKI